MHKDLISVLVTGTGGGVGQGIIKSLKLIPDLEIRIIGADASAEAAGLYACDKAVLIPLSRSPDYLDALAELLTSNAIDYYFPGTDIELAFCAEHKTELFEKYGVMTVVNPLDVVQIADDKARTSRFLADHDLPYPATWTLREARKDQDLPFPVIVKPSVGYRSIGVIKAENRDDLLTYPGNPEDVIVQELIGDDLQEFTCTIVGHHGVLSQVLALRRDLRSGDTYRAYPERNPQVEEYVRKVASLLGIEGSCNFQLRLDKDGVPKIFEINARYSGTTPLCAQLGFNPVEFYLKADLNIPYQPDILWDSAVLRFWSEAVIPNDTRAALHQNGAIDPEMPEQFNLFDGDL